MCKCSLEEWRTFLAFFKVFMMNYHGLWIINNDMFKRAIVNRYTGDVSAAIVLHEEVADVLEKTPNSIRKLEE